MNRLVIALIAGLIALYVLFSSMYVVNAREQAIVAAGEMLKDLDGAVLDGACGNWAHGEGDTCCE